MSDWEMDFDDTQVTLIERWPGKRTVKQTFTVPMSEVPNLIASLRGMAEHLREHPAHGHDGHRHG